MSHSRKHTPIFTHGDGSSDWWWKRKGRQRERGAVRMALRLGRWEALPARREVDDPWSWPSDGKRYWVGAPSGKMRK